MTNSSSPRSFTMWAMNWRRTITRRSPQGIIRPYVRPEVTWIVEQHGLFQSYYYAHYAGRDRNAREKFRGHPWYQACKDFCANWDQCSFDPGYPAEPLKTFESRVREIFSRPAHDPRYVGSP